MIVVVCASTAITIWPFQAGGPALAAACSHTWARGGGSFVDSQFADPASWAENSAPTSGSNVCFLVGDVTFFGLHRALETIEVAIGASVVLNGGTLDLTSSSSLADVYLANGGHINVGKDVTVPSGRTSGALSGEAGTLSSSTGAVLTVDGTFQHDGGNQLTLDLDVVNNGAITVSGTLVLGPGRTLGNTGSISLAPDASVTTSTGTGARLHNTGVIEFTGNARGPDAGGVRGAVQFDNDGIVRVLSGDVAMVMTGTSTGSWEVGAPGSGSCAAEIGKSPSPGARLFFRPNPSVMMTGGSVTGPGCVNVFGGTVDVGSGVVWAPDASEIFGATLRVAGDRTLPQLRLGNGGELEVAGGTATMSGPISQTSTGQFVRFGGDGRLVVPSGSAVVHEGGNGFEIADSLEMVANGPMALAAAVTMRDSASLVTTGAWSLGAGSTFAPAAGTSVRNEGTLTVDAGTGSIMFGGGAALDNVGTVRLARGTLDMRTPFVQMAGGALTGGRIEVADGANWLFFPLLTSLAGELRLEGTGHLDTSFGLTSNALNDLTTIQPGGALELGGGGDLDLTAGAANPLANGGRLSLGAGSTLTVGDYRQDAGGTLAVAVGIATHGAIAATSAALDGTLEISPVVAGQPAVSGAVIVDAATLTGAFADVSATDGGATTLGGGGGSLTVDFDAANSPIVVTNTATSGPGSFMDALDKANAAPGADTIDFAIPGAGPHSIPYEPFALAWVTDRVVIDGTSQPGYDGTRPLVELAGSEELFDGIVFDSGSAGSTIRGLSITGVSQGFAVTIFATDVTVEDSWLGVRPDGTARANAFGVYTQGSRTRVRRNLVSGNTGVGVEVDNSAGVAKGVAIEDNRIGTDAAGTGALGNGDVGLSLVSRMPGSLEVTVRGNTILANGRAAIAGFDFPSGPGPYGTVTITDNVLGAPGRGNGADSAGAATIELDRYDGVIAGNTITDNSHGPGIRLLGSEGNVRIGPNVIARNASLGITFGQPVGPIPGPEPPTPNDPLDADAGINGHQNFPVLDSTTGAAGELHVSGSLTSKPNTSYTVALFANSTCDASGHGEGETFLSEFEVETDASGIAPFDVVVGAVDPGMQLTATASGPEGTSEFSRCLALVAPTTPPMVTTRSTSVTEGTGAVVSQEVLVTIENPNPVAVPITWSALGVTAELDSGSADLDATVPTGGIMLTPGTNVVPVSFTTVADSRAEPDETFQLVWAPGTPSTMVTIIDDDDPPPVLTFGPASFTESSGGGGVLVTRNSAKAPLVVSLDSIDGTATAGSDYEAMATTVSFATGQLTATVPVAIVDDDVDEGDETFDLSFANGAFSATVTIVDDDEPVQPLTFSLSVEDVAVSEGGTVTFELVATPSRPGGTGTVDLPVELRDVTAELGVDYFSANGTDGAITIPAAGGSVFAFALVGDDDRFEVTEFFDVLFGRPEVPGEQVTARVTILDDDPLPRVTITSNTPYGEGTGTVSLNVRLDRAAGSPVTFLMTPVDGTAALGTDFTTFPNDSVTIPAGATEGNLNRFTIIDDTDAFEADQEFFGVAAYREGELVAFEEIHIIDNDLGPQARFVRQPADQVTGVLERDLFEGDASNSTLPLLVELMGDPITEPTIVTVTVQSVLADPGDFTVTPSQLTFSPGDGPKTVTFTSLGDTELEVDETVLIALQTEFGNSLGRPDDEAHVTIVDDDQSLTLTPVVSSSVGEGGTITVRVSADHAPGEFVTIPITVTGVTATLSAPGAPGDVTIDDVPGSLTIAPDETSASFQIPIVDDTVPEPDEVVRVQFGLPNQGRLTVGEKEATIVDDDPIPFDLSVEDVAVSEGGTVRLELVATPTGAGSSGPLTLPVLLRDVTAELGVDYVAANGTDGTVSIPAGGGTVVAFALVGNDDRFEVTEFFDVLFGRAEVPGEQVTARVTIEDDDPFPTVTITSNTPYGEDAGVVSLNVRLDRAAGSPVAFLMVSVDGTAERGADFTTFANDVVTIPAGATEGNLFALTIVDDTEAFEADHEFFGIAAYRSGEQLAFEQIEIIDNDDGPQARFVRGASDPVRGVLARNLVEGDTVDSTLPLLVELVGDPITTSTVVTVVADSLLADESDFSVAPVQLTFNPGDGPKTVTFTSRADAVIELDETVFVALQTEFGNSLGRPDDEAHVVIVDDDDQTPAAPEVTQFRDGWTDVQAALQQWLAQFDLAPGDAPAVVTPALAEHFGLTQLDDDLGLPAIDPASDTLSELCADLLAAGFALDFVAGGLCGRPQPPASGDMIRARYSTSLADLAKAAGFAGDPFNDATDGVLRSLATSLGLDAEGGWIGDLDVTLVVGVDAGGFYVDDATALALSVGGSVSVDGTGTIAGAPSAVDGTAAADLLVTLAPGSPRLRNLGALLAPEIDGSSSMSLSFAAGPLTLGWTGEWSASAAGVATGLQQLSGTLTLPGLTRAGAGAALDVVATLDGNLWHVTAAGEAGAGYLLAGFSLGSFGFTADIGTGALAGSGALVLVAPLPGGDRAIAATVDFDREHFAVDGRLDVPLLAVGDPELLRLVDAFIGAHFSAALPGGPLTGGVEVGAASAIVLPADPVADATDLLGTISPNGRVDITAASGTASIADGAIAITLADATFAVGPGSGPNLFEVGTATGTFPALDDLGIALTGLFLTKDGVFGASAVDVASQGLAQSVGLGGILPFDVTEVTVVFPDPANLDGFEVSVVGRFDFSQFPDLGPGFTPRVGLGGPVVTPDSPPDQNSFTFSIDVDSLANGVIRPLDVGPLTLGFDGLQAGDHVIGADITLGGFVDGEFRSEIGGSLTVDGPAGSLLDDVSVALTGSITPGSTTVVDVAGRVLLSGNLGPLQITDLDLGAGVAIAFGPAGLTFTPRLDGLSVGEVAFPFGDVMTLRATGVEFDPDPAPGGNYVEVGEQGGLTIEFDESFDALAGWTGTFANLAVGDGFVPKLLPGFQFDIGVPPDTRFGLPEFIPLAVRGVGITFPSITTAPPDGIALTPDLLNGMRIRVSGGITANATWPISAEVDGLEVDLGALTRGEFPITNLDGLSFGVEPFELPGGVVIGGGLRLGTVDVDGTTVFYGRVFGEFAVADIGGGADLVVTQYGPVLMKVRAPLGIPLGPSGIVLAGAEGAAQFGAVGIPVPPAGDPTALLNNFTLPTDLTITDQVIVDAVRPAVEAQEYTWDQGFALSIAGDLIVAAAPGVLEGRATLGINLGLPEGPSDPPGLQLVGKGEVTGFGIPLGQVGILVDFADPIEPSFDLAFASPVPGSPIALVVPGQATFGVQLRTDGVVLGTIEGLRVFTQQLIDGSLVTGGALFDTALVELAARLDEDRSRPLARLLLDSDGDGSVEPGEASRTITATFVLDRIVGRSGLPALLPATVADAAFADAARAATALLNELLLTTGQIIEDPATFGSFVVDTDAGGAGFDGLTSPGGDALAALGGVVRDATAAALQAFGDRFNPSFAMEGALRPTFFGLPIGSTAAGGELFIDRNGLFLAVEGSLIELGQSSVGQIFPVVAPAVNAALTAATLGITDHVEIGARLPFGGVVDSLLGGNDLPTFQPLDPNWAITVTGAMDVVGFEAAELTGIAFLPGQQGFIDSRVQKLFELPPGTPIDPNRIPITSQAHYDALLQYGGLLVTASLRVPRLVTDPVTQLAAFPPPPENPLEYLAWLDDLAATATETDSPARVQWFVPGIATVSTDSAAVDWASAFYLEGVWDGDLLGLDLGQATLGLTPAGLEVAGEFPLVGLTGTVTLNTALLAGGGELPTAGLELDLDTSGVVGTLAEVGVPSVLVPAIGATGQLRAFTPGFDPESPDPLRRNGGIEVSARLGTPGIIGDTGFTFALSPRSGGYDVHGSAFANRIGPIAGVTINNAEITVDVVAGQATVTVDGSADVLGAQATVHGTLAADLTGQVAITFSSGSMNLAGVQISGGALLTLTRVGGQLAGSLGINGVATLPQWLANAVNQATLVIAACVDTTGNAELALTMPAIGVGPNELVRIGRNPSQAALPPSPASCQLPVGAPGQSATGPLFRLRLANGVATAVLDGSLQFVAPGATVAGLSVRGSLNAATGTGELGVTFSGGSMALSGFSVRGSATATIAPGAFAMDVRGSLDVAGILNGARVSGTATEDGITHLDLSVAALTLPPLTVTSFAVDLDRTAASTYRLTVGANVSFAGVGALAVNGTLDSTGSGSLAVNASNLTIGGATITNGSFAVVRSGATTTLSARGRFTLFGVGLEVPQASLTLSTASGQPAIGGSLTIRPVGGGALSLGGWTIGGTLRITFTGITSRVTIDNGTLGIPGWGSVAITASIAVPVLGGSFFELAVPSGGLRLGGSPSPFFASGTFRLAFNSSNVATLSATNPSLSWKDGTTTIATIGGPSVVIRSDGFVSASLTGFSASLPGGFAFAVPSLNLLIDPAGLNARLALGAGSVTIPGFAPFATPAFTIGAATTFSRTLVADELDLGLIALHGQLVFERQQGVFRLRFAETSNGRAPFLEIEGLVDVPLPTFNVASNGTFEIDAAFPKLGPAGFQIVGAAVHLEKDGPALSDISGRITGGQLLVANAEPLALPALDFDHNSRFDETKTFSSWELGPFLQASSIEVRLRQLSSGVIQLSVLNDPNLTAFAGSASMKITELTVESDGTFDGTITGQLALFGTRLAQATFDVSKVGGAIRLTLPPSRRATLDLGFLQADMSGFADSSGAFDFSGSTSLALGVTGFSFSGSLSVQVSSADGIEGAFSGQVCIIACATTGGSLRSDGRVSGFLQVDLNGDGDFRDLGEVNAAWFVYLATGGVRVDLNRDGDFADLGDVAIGASTGGDTTDPSMTTPPNITVNANIGTGGTVRVYYTLPTATDAGQSLTVTCTPPPGSSFAVGATSVTCVATDKANNTRTRSFTVTVVANPAATVPTASNGDTVTVDAPGFMPNSLVFVRFQSDPVYVGVFRADADGRVVLELEVPAGLPAGSHDIIVEGIGPSGGVWQYVQAFQIPGGDPPTVAPPATLAPRGQLPSTGGSGGAQPLVPLGALAVAFGMVLVFVSRRRPAEPAPRASHF